MPQQQLDFTAPDANNLPEMAQIVNENFDELYASKLSVEADVAALQVSVAGIVADVYDVSEELTAVEADVAEILAGRAQPPSALWAARGAGTELGQRLLITDVGVAPGLNVEWDGAHWKVPFNRYVFLNSTPVDGIATGLEQILRQFSIPAGLFRAARLLRFGILGFDGATNNGITTRVRLGSAGTVADVMVVENNAVANDFSYYSEAVLLVASATELRRFAGQASAAGWASPHDTVFGYPQNITIPDIDTTPLIVSFTTQNTVGTDVPSIAHAFVEFIP